MIGQPPAILVTGLRAEARIASGTGVVALAGGGDAARLASMVEAALRRGARAVVSFGIAGGLEPGLAPGTVLIARGVHDGAERLTADVDWCDRLAALLPGARRADLAGVDVPAAGAGDKAALRGRTGAAAVDMESHVAARLAALHGVPFAALRVVADPAERSLPPAALVGMRPDGTADLGAVLRSLAGRPRQLPALLRTGLDARAAFAALRASRAALAPLFEAGAQSQDVAVQRPDPARAGPEAAEPGAA
ncbi:phosphorylase [Lichenibacterium dinghuense]|uniref:phosphorylase n=1 Tax=Lichenibacterium dinghuense TaxID=2895977 RepID=UPI001F005F8A|nr:phosphorylase [Lichenibacterium sp. 6Y81]